MNIIIKERLNDYIAYFVPIPERLGCGRTKIAAVRDLILSHTEIPGNFKCGCNEDEYRDEINKLKETLSAKQILIDKQSSDLQYYNKFCDSCRNLSIKDGRIITTLLADIIDRDKTIEKLQSYQPDPNETVDGLHRRIKYLGELIEMKNNHISSLLSNDKCFNQLKEQGREIKRLTKCNFEHCETIGSLRKEIEKKDCMLIEHRMLLAEDTRRVLKFEKEVADRNIELGRLSYLLDESRVDVGLREKFIEEDRVEMEKLRSHIEELKTMNARCIESIFDSDKTIYDLRSTIAVQQKQTNRDGRIIKGLNNKINKIERLFDDETNMMFKTLTLQKIIKILKEG